MTIEEKAKAYDEAIERARKEYKTHEAFKGFCEMLVHIFPKLAVSEDEKIRKAIGYAIGQSTHSDGTLINGVSSEEALDWLEKQGEQNPVPDWMPKFLDELRLKKNYFDWDEHKAIEGGILAIIKWMKPNYFNGKDSEQKSADKVEPKFKVGDWIVESTYASTWLITKVFTTEENVTAYNMINQEGRTLTIGSHNIDYHYHLWTIKDAKDGDVIVDKSDGVIGIFQSIGHHPDGGSFNDPSYCFLHCRYDDGYFYADFEHGNTIDSDDLIPASKEQRDTLMKAMSDAGYAFDFEKKELKKIEEEEYNGEDYGIDSLYHAQRILEKTLGKVDSYQSDDGILEHKCAITAVKKLYAQKHVWSKEDEAKLKSACAFIRNTSLNGNEGVVDSTINWLKSIKNRVQPKQEWSEEDENNILFLTSIIEECFKDKEKITLCGDTVCANFTKEDVINRLKSLKDRHT